MSATNRGSERKAYDFYATPPETIRAFLANFDGISSGDRILEPSAGNGQIVKVLREGGYDNRTPPATPGLCGSGGGPAA